MKFNFSMDKVIRTEDIKHEDMPRFLDSDDAVILKTSWKELKSSAQSFKSRRLVQVGDERLEFKMSLQAFLIYSLVILIGIFTIIMMFIGTSSGNSNPIYGFLTGFLFIGIGIGLFYYGTKKIVIEKNPPSFFRGNKLASKMINPTDVEDYHSLKDVHAVQLIKKYINNTDSQSYYNHELNLIFKDASRLHILNHKDNESITNQAEIVSNFLNIPLWDARSNKVNATISKLHNSLSFLFNIYNWYKFLAIIVIAAGLIFFIFFKEDPDPKKDLSTVSETEKVVLKEQYTKELFELAKLKTTNLTKMNKLAKTGINIDAIDNQGRTPLFYSVMAKNRDNINFFIRKFAYLYVKDNDGIGLKDLLDPKKDRILYFMIEDAQFQEKANSRGKMVYQINRKYDKSNNVISVEVLER